MRISSVTVRRYRSLKDVTIHFDNYGVFIGANGSGKSSVLYALDWFFNGTPLSATDLHGYQEGGPLDSSSTIEVTVTFVDLTTRDCDRLEQYGRGEKAVIRRTWYAANGQTKTVGNSKQGDGFADVRADQGAPERRRKYRDLRTVLAELPDLGGSAGKEAIFEALVNWECDPANANKLVDVPDADANQMMGWNGANVIRECLRFVLIPAATSIIGEVGTATRGTALTELVGAFMSNASSRAQNAWLLRHAEAVSELAIDIRTSVESATKVQADRINARLVSLVPNASVNLTPSVPDFSPKVDATIATSVTIDGITNDVSQQGHGVQRAVMISMFQAIVPDEEITRVTHASEEDEDETASEARLAETISGLPSIIVAIEEPEIYQHPIRARSFARTLHELSGQGGVQVLLATHSPYFIQPEQFAALHRFTISGGITSISGTTIAAVASTSGVDEDKVEKAITQYVPTEFCEGFFADAVALVEGQTDRVVLEEVARKLGSDLDHLGVTLLSVEGKGGLRVARAILNSLGIPTHVVADGDFTTSTRKAYKDKTAEEINALRLRARESHKSATETVVSSLPASSAVSVGKLPYSFGDDTVVCDDFTIWKDDIEEELQAWASFEGALHADGITLADRSNKNLLAYRNAVITADDADMPAALKLVVAAIAKRADHQHPPIDEVTDRP